MKPMSISCFLALNTAWNALGAALAGPVPPISCLWSCQKKKKVWRGGDAVMLSWLCGGWGFGVPCRTPWQPLHLQCTYLSMRNGLLCWSARKNHCHKWPYTMWAVIYSHPSGAKNKHKIFITCRSHPCKELLWSWSCCGRVTSWQHCAPGHFEKH